MTIQTIRVNKAEASFEVDFAKLPEASRAHVIAYGLRQILNDAAAGSEAGEASKEAVNKRLDNLLAGTLRASSGRTSDPVAKRAKELAEAAIRAGKVKIAGVVVTMKHPDIARVVAKVAESKHDQAKRDVEARAKDDVLDIEV